MIYVIRKADLKIIGYADSIKLAKELVPNELDYTFTEDLNMNYISTVVYFDGKCVYNNVDFWNKALDYYDDYDSHTVTDIFGKAIPLNRFKTERESNFNRINAIDGRPGEISYNMTVGKEFISLFRQECILTDFKKDADTSPMIIFNKLATVIAMIDIGGFREARQYLAAALEAGTITDQFLTEERIAKYIDMLTAADSIEYATDEDYFYTVPEAEATTEESTDESTEEPTEPSDEAD